MSHLLPDVRQYYAEVGVILEKLLGENASQLIPKVLERVSRRSESAQSVVEHEDPFQVAVEVGKKTYKGLDKKYASFRKMRDSEDWKKAVQAFDQQYLRKFAAEDTLEAVASIVAAHVSSNKVEMSEVGGLIEAVHKTLSGLGGPHVVPDRPNPAVPIRRSVEPDYLVCLEDGRKLKMLKRHLKSQYNMSPEQYRQKWGLPSDYPMVAPRYAEQRSALAKELGLGRETKRRATGRTAKVQA